MKFERNLWLGLSLSLSTFSDSPYPETKITTLFDDILVSVKEMGEKRLKIQRTLSLHLLNHHI